TLTSTGPLTLPLSDEQAVRRFCRGVAQGRQGGLIEAGIVPTSSGPAVCFIYKRQEGPDTPVAVTGMLMTPVVDGTHVWAFSAHSSEGARESLVALAMLRDGTLTDNTYTTSWNADPYDRKYRGVPVHSLRCMADDERHDRQ